MRSKAGLLFKRITAVVAITLMLSPLALAQEPGNSESVRVNVDLVRVPVSVTQRGIPVKGLTMDTFQLREDSTPQVIQYFWQELDLPLSIGLIVDVSGSQAGLVGKHKQTVTTFLKQVLGPEDRAMLITVSSQARLVTDFTNSIDELSRGIDRIKRLGGKSDPIIGEPCRGTHHRTALLRRRLKASPCGGTALWQGVYSAAHFKMKNIEGRKALIILSDGIDTGSDRTLEDAIEAAESAGTPVYTIKYASLVAFGLLPVVALKQGMNKLSDETGGTAYGLMHGDIRKVFDNIENDLRNLYVLGYVSTNTAHNGTFRKIEVTTSMNGMEIRARKGYVAARD
jgi:VWFA-related protein